MNIADTAAASAPGTEALDDIQRLGGIQNHIGHRSTGGPTAADIVCKIQQCVELLLSGLLAVLLAEVIDGLAVVFLQNFHQETLCFCFADGCAGTGSPGAVAVGPLALVPISLGSETLEVLDHIDDLLAGGHLLISGTIGNIGHLKDLLGSGSHQLHALGSGLAGKGTVIQDHIFAIHLGSLCGHGNQGQHHNNSDKQAHNSFHKRILLCEKWNVYRSLCKYNNFVTVCQQLFPGEP